MPRTSVIIPSYQSAATLPRVLSALRPQVTARESEVLVVESSGRAVGEALQATWPWVRVLSFEHRVLPGRARNIAAEVAAGELLAFIDADAIPAPDWLERLEGALRGGVEMVAGAILNGTPEAAWGTAGYLLEFVEWLPERREPLFHAASCNLLVRRTAFERGGRFPEDVWPGEDTVLTGRFGRAGTLAFAPSARVTHLNRVGMRDVLAQQRRLGAAWVNVCRQVAMPGAWLGEHRIAPLAVVGRAHRLVHQIRLSPSARSGAARSMPLVAIGLLAWGTGILRAPRDVAIATRRSSGDGRSWTI